MRPHLYFCHKLYGSHIGEAVLNNGNLVILPLHEFLISIVLKSLITSRTRLRMLVKFFINSANSGYLNGLADEFGESTNAIRRELNNLSEAGYLIQWKSKNKIVYSANTEHTLFKVLQKIIRHHLGLEKIIESVLIKMGNVNKIVLIGDYALGNDTGTIEVILVGDKIDTAYIKILQRKLKDVIQRSVIFYINISIPDNRIELYDKNNSELNLNN
jgi:hypothetical protein